MWLYDIYIYTYTYIVYVIISRSQKSKTNELMFWMIYVKDFLPQRQDIVFGLTDTIRYMSYSKHSCTYIYTLW